MLDAMMMFSLTVALTGFFFWVLLEKGCLPALLVLFSPFLVIVIIVIVGLCKVVYDLHGIGGIIGLVFVAFVVLTPITLGVGILLDIEYGIDIFKWAHRDTKQPVRNKRYTQPNLTKVTRSNRKPTRSIREPNEFLEQNWYPYKKPKRRKTK